MKIALIDHQDSFVHNLYQALASQGAEVRTLRSDAAFREVERFDPEAIVLSPGPGHPSDRRTLGVTYRILEELSPEVPTLGVCLGHQAIAYHYGARVVRAPRPCHGETSRIRHGDDSLFEGVGNPLVAARYHSLVVRESSLPPTLQVTAWEGGEAGRIVMGLRHRHHPVLSLQFHPESYLTPEGPRLLRNFLREAHR